MAQLRKPYGGVYENMDFVNIYGPYVYAEYPKHVITGAHGQYVVVNNASEEAALKAKMQKDQDDAPALVEAYVPDPEKEILISRARELGVPFNPKWSKAKLTATIKDAEAEVDDLPAEEEDATDERATLYKEAKALGISERGMNMWGIPRLKAAIADAKDK